jgi:hypothetical protein
MMDTELADLADLSLQVRAAGDVSSFFWGPGRHRRTRVALQLHQQLPCWCRMC